MSSAESNFLVHLKNKLTEEGIYEVINNSNSSKFNLDNDLPNYLDEFAGYIATSIPTLEKSSDFSLTIQLIPVLQSRLDRFVWVTALTIPTKNKLTQARKLALGYIMVNLEEVKTLKSKDLRDAAVSYLLDDFDHRLLKLESFYDLGTMIKYNINSAIKNIELQLKLYNAANYQKNNVS